MAAIAAQPLAAPVPAGAPPVTRPAQGWTVAIVAGEGPAAVREPLPSLLAEILQQQPGVRLVERDQIRAALKELGAAASGLTDAGASMRLGKMLSADVFIRLSPTDDSKEAAMAEGPEPVRVPAVGAGSKSARMRVLDSRTGLILDDGPLTVADLTADKAPIGTRLIQSFSRIPRVGAPTRFIGILDVRAEEIGHSLDPLADQVRAMLSEDLVRSPAVFLLERDDLRRLTEERNLSDLPQDLRSSTTLLECGLRKAAAGQLAVAIRIKPLGGTPKDVVVTVPEGNVPAIRTAVLNAVVLNASLVGVAPKASDPSVEAVEFDTRANVLYSQKRYAQAAGVAEVALAISPSTERRQTAYRMLRVAVGAEAGKKGSAFQRLDLALRAGNVHMALLAELEASILARPATTKPTTGDLVSPRDGRLRSTRSFPGILPSSIRRKCSVPRYALK